MKGNTPVQAIVSASLFESGGRSVNRSLTRTLWPADALVGVRPLFDDAEGANANASAGFELMRYGSDGRPRPAAGLKVSLVRELRDYHWTHDEDSGWRHDFTRRFQTVETRSVDAGATATRIDFPVEWGDYRLEVFDPATKLTMRYPFRAGWGWGDENRGLDARPDKVKLALDKTAYRAGDRLKVTLTPPHAGKGMVMVESDRMLFVQAVDVKPGTVVEIPVTPGLGTPRRVRDRAGVPRRQRGQQDHPGARGGRGASCRWTGATAASPWALRCRSWCAPSSRCRSR